LFEVDVYSLEMAHRQDNPNTSGDVIAQDSHWMVDAMQSQLVAHVPSMDNFMRHNPSNFYGKANMDESDSWVRKTEKIFKVITCPDEKSSLMHLFC